MWQAHLLRGLEHLYGDTFERVLTGYLFRAQIAPITQPITLGHQDCGAFTADSFDLERDEIVP